jgi:hypothetical protein
VIETSQLRAAAGARDAAGRGGARRRAKKNLSASPAVTRPIAPTGASPAGGGAWSVRCLLVRQEAGGRDMRRKVIYADPSFFPGYHPPPRALERMRVWGPLLAISAAVVAGALLGRSRAPHLPPAASTAQAPIVDVDRAPPERPLMRVQGEPMVITVTVPARKSAAEKSEPATPAAEAE